jgi:anti-sigma factor ChrR (cupin superfamily)
MRINADFSKRVVIRPEDYDWVQSPAMGVERMMLDRIGDEVARATTIVRFASNSYFDAHTHGGGEEFFVLEGIFSDESGDYPKGSYVRNPIGTSHKPHTHEGCTILVKLHQFAKEDDRQFAIQTEAERLEQKAEGISELLLHEFEDECVRLERWMPESQIPLHHHDGGDEIFVLDGSYCDEFGSYSKGSWIRQPHGSSHEPRTDEGCLLLIKTGHLPQD